MTEIDSLRTNFIWYMLNIEDRGFPKYSAMERLVKQITVIKDLLSEMAGDREDHTEWKEVSDFEG